MKEANSIQVIFILETKPQKYFWQNMVIFIASNVSFLNPYWDGNMRRYGTV